MELLDSEKLYCNNCRINTNHQNVFRDAISLGFSEDGGEYVLESFIWYCMGCDIPTFQIIAYNTMILENDGEPKLNIFTYPERVANQISSKRFVNLPSHLEQLYNEIICAFNKECGVLASIGLRSLLEGICKDKEIQGKDLQKKIDNMSFLSSSIKKNLHGIRFMGNDAAHELDTLGKGEILIAIEIMEDVMSYTYELDYKSSRILEIMEKKHEYKNEAS